MNSSNRVRHSSSLPLVVGGTIALASAMGIGRFVYTPILPEMVAALHLTASEAGLIASANFAGYLIGALAAAASFFAPQRRGWMLGALLVSALTTGTMALTSSLIVFVALRFLGGFASAFALVFTSSLVLDRLATAGRGHMAGHQFAGVGIGIVISAILVAQLAALHVTWQTHWIACAALSLLAVIAVAALIPPRPESASTADANGNVSIGLPLAMLVIAYGLFGFGYVITATFLVQLVRTSAAIAPLEPVIWVIFGLASIPSVSLWSAIGRRIGIGHGYALACLIEAIGVLSSVLWVSSGGVILATVLVGGTFMGITLLGLLGARRLSPGAATRIIGLMTASFGVGQIIGPIFAGWVRDLTGTFLLPSVAAAVALLAAAVLAWRFSAPALR